MAARNPPREAHVDPQPLRQGDTHNDILENSGISAGGVLGDVIRAQNQYQGCTFNTVNNNPQLSTGSEENLKPQSVRRDDKPHVSNDGQLVENAKTLENLGQHLAALNVYYCIFSSRRTIGAWTKETLEAAYEVARLLEELRDYKKALNWYLEIYRARRKTLGDSDPLVCRTVCSVARMLQKQNNHEGALSWYGGVFELKKKALGSKNRETLEAAYDVAEAWSRKKQYDTKAS